MVMLSEIMDMYFHGEEGKTIFSHPFNRSLLEEDDASKLLKKVHDAGDDRSMVLVSAMVCETYIDLLLAILLPKYSRLLDGAGNFTFSTKIKLLDSFEIIPSHLTRAADLVRQVRNEFAHNLEVSSLSDVDPKIFRKLRGLYDERKIRTDIGPDDLSNLFSTVSYLATSVLYAYRESLHRFAAAVRQPEFANGLAAQHLSEHKVVIKALTEHDR
ncbi:conserved hypothetical protein [Candidatus Nitrotoga sp. 1052]|nr:conserved hypothetical protein [Candidatus Nitrotoga sp. 1052]